MCFYQGLRSLSSVVVGRLKFRDLGFDMGIKYEYTEYGLYSDCSLIFL